jgi:hypothetical protein
MIHDNWTMTKVQNATADRVTGSKSEIVFQQKLAACEFQCDSSRDLFVV